MQDRELKLSAGGPVLAGALMAIVALVAGFVYALDHHNVPLLLAVGVAAVGWVISLFGFVINSPNTARVVQLFGTYVGTLTDVGFFWGNPFYSLTTVTLRVRTFETGVTQTEEVKDAAGHVLSPASHSRRPSKVNDRDGTPIEIAAVIVWKVVNAAEAVFSVEKYEDFVHVQSEAALRNLASRYRYDGAEGDEYSLRGHIDEVAGQLKGEVQDRMHTAGIEVVEARISHLAYAPEIAAAMLQRQQAGAMIAARRLIVDGAVGMVEHAIESLSTKGLVDLDPERKAAMVSNLMVVLCSHATPQPVLNTGTLYQ